MKTRYVEVAQGEKEMVPPIGKLVRVCDLAPSRENEMYALMEDHYLGMNRDQFDDDLTKKQWVIEVEEPHTKRLMGFSTLMLLTIEANHRPVRAVFSGDTIIDKKSWGQRPLFQVSGWFLRGLIDAFPDDDWYWFLISKGYKTYRFLPVFFKTFSPRYDSLIDPGTKAIIDALGAAIAPEDYDAVTGIIRGNPNSYRLQPGVADLDPQRLRDPHIQFFAMRNPQHASGDELCCVAPLRLDNFTTGAFRAMGSRPPASVVNEFPRLAKY